MKIIEIHKVIDLLPGVDKCLDKPGVGVYLSDVNLPLLGWAYLPDRPIEGIFVKSGRDIVASAACDIPRPKLREKLGEEIAAPLGFKGFIETAKLDHENFELVLIAKAGDEELPLWMLHCRQAEGYSAELLSKKLFYMHIAKTGGSSVNSFIYDHYPNGSCREHIEAMHLNKATKKEVLDNKLYLSGHITLEVALERKYIDKSFKTFTILRNPMDQLISHLSWVKRLSFFENQKDFENHPEHIQKIATRLGQLTLEDFILSMTQPEKDLFDNVQTRYLANAFNREIFPEDLPRALKCLELFDIVGINERLADSLRLLCAVMDWPKPVSPPRRENVSQYKIPRTAFSNKDLELLETLIVFDRVVYDRARELLSAQQKKMFDSVPQEKNK